MQVAERREIRLREWEEVTGTFRGIMKEDFSISVLFDDSQLIFNSGSHEAQIAEEKLKGTKAGNKISILRTDLPEKPVIVRTT